MTKEHRLLVDVSDIVGLRLQCTRCQAGVTFRLDAICRLPAECPGCKEPWRVPHAFPTDATPSSWALVEQLYDVVKAYGRSANGAPVKLRFELDDQQ